MPRSPRRTDVSVRGGGAFRRPHRPSLIIGPAFGHVEGRPLRMPTGCPPNGAECWGRHAPPDARTRDGRPSDRERRGGVPPPLGEGYPSTSHDANTFANASFIALACDEVWP